VIEVRITAGTTEGANSAKPFNVDGLGPSAYVTIEHAAARLSTTPVALRARCRRHARRENREIVARLGAGVIAYKFGASWRVRFPD
jgi:hypothetical protein